MKEDRCEEGCETDIRRCEAVKGKVGVVIGNKGCLCEEDASTESDNSDGNVGDSGFGLGIGNDDGRIGQDERASYRSILRASFNFFVFNVQ